MPPQYLFSAFFLVGFMTIGILIGFLPQVRNRYKARPLTPGQVPSPRSQLRGEGWRTANFVGELHFKSASAKAGIICGVVLATCAVMGGVAVLAAPISGQAAPPLRVAVPAIAAPLVLIAYSYFRPKRAAQSLYVDQNRAITLIRGDVKSPSTSTTSATSGWTAAQQSGWARSPCGHVGDVSRHAAKHFHALEQRSLAAVR